VRASIATGKLAVDGDTETYFAAESVVKAKKMRKILCVRSCLDSLKDYFPVDTFPLEDLLKLWKSGNVTAAY
jgi:hypothetical protein